MEFLFYYSNYWRKNSVKLENMGKATFCSGVAHWSSGVTVRVRQKPECALNRVIFREDLGSPKSLWRSIIRYPNHLYYGSKTDLFLRLIEQFSIIFGTQKTLITIIFHQTKDMILKTKHIALFSKRINKSLHATLEKRNVFFFLFVFMFQNISQTNTYQHYLRWFY